MPVCTSQPIVPIVQYDPNMPPYVPTIPGVPVEVQHLVGTVAAQVCNEVGLKAFANPARMACYNILVNNYWQNNEFCEVVKLILGYLYISYLKGTYRMPDHGVNDCVGSILILYCSNIILMYPEVKSTVDPQLHNAALQNASTFNNLKAEIINMYNNGGSGGYYPQQQGMMGANAHASMVPMQQQMVPQPNGQVVMTPNGPMFVPAGMVQQPQMMPMQQQFVQQPTQFQNQPLQSCYPQTQNAFSNGNNNNNLNLVDNIRQDRFFSRAPAPPVEQPIIQQQVKQVKSEQTHLTVMGGNEMDRAKHQITFFGNTYRTDSVVRNQAFTESVNKLNNASIKAEVDNPVVYPTWMLEPCLDLAIINAKMLHVAQQQQDQKPSVFRCFGVVASPIISHLDIDSYVKEILQVKSFIEIVNKIKSLSMSLSQKEDEKQYADSIIGTLSHIDIMLTKIVNNFLNNSLRLTVKIESFTDDVGGLPEYLFNKFGQMYSTMFNKFEQEIICSITEKIKEDDRTQLCTNLDIPDSVNVALIPMNYSFTFVFMTDKELGYNTGDTLVNIDAETTPVLYSLAISLQTHKREMQLNTIYDLLITSDGVKYRLYTDYTGTNKYLIVKC